LTTAPLDLALDRVWFILDSHQRLWQEETTVNPVIPCGISRSTW
jgi:hypothetical protein